MTISRRRRKAETIDVENNDLETENVEVDEVMTYEAIRERNIREREKLFQELGFDEAKSGLVPVKKAAPKALQLVTNTPRSSEDRPPPRKSLRLQKVDPETGIKKEEVSQPVEIFDENPRLPLEDLDLETLIGGDEEGVENGNSFLKGISKHVKHFTHEKKITIDQKALKKPKLLPERVAKVVPDRIFSVAIHPSETKIIVAAGGKWGTIGIWDVEKSSALTLKPHSRPVNCMTFNKFRSEQLITTSYDGTVRLFDITKQKAQVLFGELDEESYVTYHSQVDSNNYLVTMGRGGWVGLVDTRIPDSTKPSVLMRVFEKASAKTISVHPLKQDLFVCPSNKGDCGLFDLRKPSKNKAMKTVVSYQGHQKSLSSALISPLTGSNLVTVCYDNKLRVYQTEGDGKTKTSIPHNNQTGRWLTTFKAEWHPNSDDIFFVGSMAQPRQIGVFAANGDKIHTYLADDLASVCSIVKCHPTQNVVVGGNSSGRVHVFC